MLTTPPAQTITTNQTLFRGYSVDLLRGLKSMGLGIIGDQALFEAAQAYNAPANSGGSLLGPALLTEDARQRVVSVTTIAVPEGVGAPDPAAAPELTSDEADPWASHDLESLIALAAVHHVTLPRVKTPGKVQAALVAAGVTP